MKPSGQGGRGQGTVQQFSVSVRRRSRCSAKVCDLAVRPTEGLYLWSPYGFHLRCASVSRLRAPIDLATGSPVLGSVDRRSGDLVGPNDAVWRPTPNSGSVVASPPRRNKSVETGRAGCPSPPFCGSCSNQTRQAISETSLPFNVESVFLTHSPITRSGALGPSPRRSGFVRAGGTARPTLEQRPNPPGRAGCLLRATSKGPEPAVRSAPCPTTFRQQPTASLRLSTTTRSETIPRLLTIRSLLFALQSPISNLLTAC